MSVDFVFIPSLLYIITKVLFFGTKGKDKIHGVAEILFKHPRGTLKGFVSFNNESTKKRGL